METPVTELADILQPVRERYTEFRINARGVLHARGRRVKDVPRVIPIHDAHAIKQRFIDASNSA
jgi:hypothetical protein